MSAKLAEGCGSAYSWRGRRGRRGRKSKPHNRVKQKGAELGQNTSLPQILKTFPCEVLHVALPDVVEQRIDRKVPPHSVFLCGAKLDLRYPAGGRVRLGPQVHEIDLYSLVLDLGCLQVLGLIWVGPDHRNVCSLLAVRCQVLVQVVRELLPTHGVQSDVNVVRASPEELIPHPTSRTPNLDLLVSQTSGDAPEQVEESTLLLVQIDAAHTQYLGNALVV
mmetsp:Transcript_4126/g.11996  ORF Transcript_4126/g.11996 Transcript_4126/m.11996 type:complete len:220 (-) Transcript_4126:73-732(-)